MTKKSWSNTKDSQIVLRYCGHHLEPIAITLPIQSYVILVMERHTTFEDPNSKVSQIIFALNSSTFGYLLNAGWVD